MFIRRAKTRLAVAWLAVVAPVWSASPSATPVRVSVGGAVVTVPAGADYERKDWRGVASISIRPAPGARIDFLHYGWLGNLLAGGPTSAAGFLKGLKDSEGLKDFQIVAPVAALSLKGLPAWSFTRRYRMGNPSRGIPDKDVEEKYLLIQRKWGFYVLQFDQSPALFSEDEPKFQDFVDQLSPASEFPLGPAPTIGLLALACIAAVSCGVVVARNSVKVKTE